MFSRAWVFAEDAMTQFMTWIFPHLCGLQVYERLARDFRPEDEELGN